MLVDGSRKLVYRFTIKFDERQQCRNWVRFVFFQILEDDSVELLVFDSSTARDQSDRF